MGRMEKKHLDGDTHLDTAGMMARSGNKKGSWRNNNWRNHKSPPRGRSYFRDPEWRRERNHCGPASAEGAVANSLEQDGPRKGAAFGQLENEGKGEKSPATTSKVGGRLLYFKHNWKKLGSEWLDTIVEKGYAIPTMEEPVVPRDLPEFFGPKEKEKEIKKHVEELLEKDAIYQVNGTKARQGVTSPLLLVKKKNGKWRPCMDLRFVNRALPYKKFKMEGLKQLRQMIKKGDFMTSIDLKDGYLHVPIAEESQRLLQFKFKEPLLQISSDAVWAVNSTTHFYKDSTFGSTGVQISRNPTPRISGRFHYFGEVGRTVSPRHTICVATSGTTGVDSQRGKIGLGSKNEARVFGLRIGHSGDATTDTKRQEKEVPELMQASGKVGNKRSYGEVKNVGSSAGQTPKHSTSSTFLVAPSSKSDSAGKVTNGGKEAGEGQLGWPSHGGKGTMRRTHLVDKLPERLEWKLTDPFNRSGDIYSDASDSGYGGCLILKGKRYPKVVQGHWTVEEQQWSTNKKELVAAERTVSAYLKWARLKNCGSPLVYRQRGNPGIHQQNGRSFPPSSRGGKQGATAIANRREVKLMAEHVPGVRNKVADTLSRLPKDRSDWRLNREVFKMLDRLWGPHTIDWFATRNNSQLPRFASWTADAKCTYVDALKNLHRKENGFANPPFAVIGLVLQRLRATKNPLTLVVPAWPSQHWWPMILELMVGRPSYTTSTSGPVHTFGDAWYQIQSPAHPHGG